MMTVARSAGDVLSDHTVFEVESIDRMYCNVWVPRLAYGAGVQGFFVGHRGHHYASTALMDPMTKAFVADIHGFVAARGLELVSFGKERKDDVAQQFLARFTGTEGVLFVGRAQEKALVWRTQRRYTQAGESYAWLVRSTAFVNYFYFYCVDEDFGPFFIKFCTYFPYTAKLCLNGNEWAKRQAAKAGIGFEALDNGFAAVDDPAALQRICDSLGPEQIDALLRKWLRDPAHPVHRRRRGRRLPLRAVDPAGRVLPDPDAGPPGLRADLLRAGHPRQPRYRPPRPGRADLRPADHRGRKRDTGPVPHPGDHRRGHPIAARRLQEHQSQAVPQGRESAAHRDHDQQPPRLPRQQTADQPARTAADRLLRQPAPARRPNHQPRPHPRRASLPSTSPPRSSPRRAPAPRAAFGDTRVQALLQALLVYRLLVHGFTNRDLRTLIAPLLGTTAEHITAGQMTYDLRRLRLHGLIERVPRTRRYTVTGTGLQHALLFTHAHDQLLRAGLAQVSDPDPPRKTKLHNAARDYQAAVDELTQQAQLAA